MRYVLAAALLCAAAPGCHTSEDPIRECESTQELAAKVLPPVDLLFVVDRSPGMAAAADHVRASLATIGAALDELVLGERNRRLDLRVAFVSSDLGAGGEEVAGCSGDGDGARFAHAPQVTGCTAPNGSFLASSPQPWFSCADEQSCREPNYTGSLADALPCIAPLETSTCPFSQPLEAMKRALDGSVPENHGFVRPNSLLYIVFITGGDDCSAADPAFFDAADPALGPLSGFRCVTQGVVCDGGPVEPTPGEYRNCQVRRDSYLQLPEHYWELLHSIKHPDLVTVSVIAGGPLEPLTVLADPQGEPTLAPACTSEGATALPSTRLSAFRALEPRRSTEVSLCQPQLDASLASLVSQLAWTLDEPCLRDPIAIMDQDAEQPGIQLACAVTERSPYAAEQQVLPCAMAEDRRPAADTPLPCWWVEPVADCSAQVHFEHATPWPGSRWELRCESECVQTL